MKLTDELKELATTKAREHGLVGNPEMFLDFIHDFLAALPEVEREPVAWLHQTRTSSDVITDEVKMFLLRQYERWEFHSSVQRPSVCKAENYTKPLYLHPPTEEIESLRRDAERLGETVARAIYMQWRDVTGYVPWVEGGNSLMQDSARRIANTAIDAAMKESKNETT